MDCSDEKCNYAKTKDGNLFIISGENYLPKLYDEIVLDNSDKIENREETSLDSDADMTIIYTTRNHIFVYIIALEN